MNTQIHTLEEVKRYYGTILQSSADLKTSACCATGNGMSPQVKQALAEINDEVLNRFYGCGSPLPPLLHGCTVLDLGCGSGRDVFLAARLAGPDGKIIGVDMTESQLDVARRNVPAQMERFGYKRTNVEFLHGYLENLAEVGIPDNSVDVVISNCVLNLSPDKDAVFSEIYRVLKPGGELYFSDVFAGSRVPVELQNDPILRGECLGGALYVEDFRRCLSRAGCDDFRICAMHPIAIGDADIEARLGMISFHSITVRAFKLNNLEDRCEDYGQVATYLGGIQDYPHHFDLDDHHRFLIHKPVAVCGNTAAMLQDTRYAPYFSVHGDRTRHFGLFNCAPAPSRAGMDAPGPCC